MDLLLLCDRHGKIDMTYEAIARVTGVPLDKVIAAISELMKPDFETRSGKENGARLARIDPARPWGWRIINHSLYRGMEHRRTRWRENKRNWRKKRKVSSNVPEGPRTSSDVLGGPHVSSDSPSECPTPVLDGPQASSPVRARPRVSRDSPSYQNQNQNQNQNGEREEEGSLGLETAKELLSLLSREGFNRTFDVQHWSTDTEQLVRDAMPLSRADLELLLWFYRLPADHEIFSVTMHKQKFSSVLEDLVGEVQKVRRARKMLMLSDELEEEVEKNCGPDGWEAVAHELYPRMTFPESFWDITSPEVMERIKERLAG